MPPPGTAGGYTLIERRWRCVQHYLFSCKASPCGCPDPTDLWADLWDLLPPDSPARERVRVALRVDSFDADSVFEHCMPWLLDPFFFLQAAPVPGVMLCAPLLPPLFSWLAPLWRTTLCLWLRVRSLLGSSVALCQLFRCLLCLVLLGVAPLRSAPPGVLRPKPRWGRAWSPIWFFFFGCAQNRS
jgi:hypothetical protein